ncbi:hypothetical protein ACWDUM_03805 [Rhodococcus sp. NPDC003322]
MPTAPPEPGSCGWREIAFEGGLSDAMRNSVWAILIAAVIAQVVTLVIAWRTGADRSLKPVARWVRNFGWVLLAAGVSCFLFFPDFFAAHGHTIAASLMFAGIVGVAVASAVSASYTPNAGTYVRAYQAIAGWMFATLVAVLVVHLAFPDFGHLVLVAEVLLIAEFATFWIVQTVELWNVVDRTDLYERGQAPEKL